MSAQEALSGDIIRTLLVAEQPKRHLELVVPRPDLGEQHGFEARTADFNEVRADVVGEVQAMFHVAFDRFEPPLSRPAKLGRAAIGRKRPPVVIQDNDRTITWSRRKGLARLEIVTQLPGGGVSNTQLTADESLFIAGFNGHRDIHFQPSARRRNQKPLCEVHYSEKPSKLTEPNEVFHLDVQPDGSMQLKEKVKRIPLFHGDVQKKKLPTELLEALPEKVRAIGEDLFA